MRKISSTLNRIKDYYPHILAASLIILLIISVYWRDLEIVANEAINSEALSHIILVPFFTGFLLYQRKELFTVSLVVDRLQRKPKIKLVDELVGLSLCLIALLTYWYGSYTFYPLAYHLLSLPIFISGVILILFNLKTLRALLPPILLLLFLVPIPNEIMQTIGGNLANINSQASYTLLKTIGIPVTLTTAYGAPTLILTTTAGQPATFTVDLPCSGIYTLIAFIMFTFFLTLIVSTSPPKKLLIFTIGFAIFETLSIVRLSTILSAAYLFGEEIAMLIFHTITGLLLTFIGMLITLFTAEKLLKVKLIQKTAAASCPDCKKPQKNLGFCPNCGKFHASLLTKPSQKFWAKLLILLLAFPAVALSINAPTFAVAQNQIEVTSTWENATNIFPQVPEYTLKFLYRDVEYERIAKQDASLVYAYLPTNYSEPAIFVMIGSADSISNLHNWEVCLISYQTAQGKYPIVSVIDSRDIQLIEEGNFPLTARYLVFTTPENYTQVTLYWYEKATFKTSLTVQQKYVRISLVILTYDAENYPQYEDTLLTFGQAIAAHWQPIKTQSLISLGIPAQQALLALSIAVIIVVKTSQHADDWRRRTNNLKIFNNFASPEDKMLLQTISELSKEKPALTTEEINNAIKSKTGSTLQPGILLQKLNRLQEYGFIKLDLILRENKPNLVWKNQTNF